MQHSSHPRACRDANDLPYYMQHAFDDHRSVSFETAVRTIARRENQFIHIVAGSMDCPVSNVDTISIRYVGLNNGGYWWGPETNVALVSNVVDRQCGDLASEPGSVVDSLVPVPFAARGQAGLNHDSEAVADGHIPVPFAARGLARRGTAIDSDTSSFVPVPFAARGQAGSDVFLLIGTKDQEPCDKDVDFGEHHVLGDIVEAGLVNSTYEGSTDGMFVEKDGIVTCIQNNPQICLHAKPTRKYYVKLWLVDTGCGHDLVSLKSVRELENMFKTGGSEVVFATANGSTPAKGRVKLQVPGLDEIINRYILADTPAVLSVGRRCRAEGYSFLWLNGCKPFFTKLLPNGTL